MKKIINQLRILIALLDDILETIKAIRLATERWASEAEIVQEFIEGATTVKADGLEGFPCEYALRRAGYTDPSQLPHSASGLKKVAGLTDEDVYYILEALVKRL